MRKYAARSPERDRGLGRLGQKKVFFSKAAAVLVALASYTACGTPPTPDAGVDSGADAGRAMDAASSDASVPEGGTPFTATMPIPDSQTIYCIDSDSFDTACPSEGEALYGQDGNYRVNLPSYDTSTPGVVTEQVSGLMWQRNNPAYMTWAEADAHCEALTLASFTDWRLPTMIELLTLVDYGGQPPIDPVFEGTAIGSTPSLDYHWTSSGNPLFLVFFATGTVERSSALDFPRAFRCVRRAVARAEPPTRYSIFEGVVRDNVTGLLWQQPFDPTARTWAEALSYCEGLSLGGFASWRLPNVKELASLVAEDVVNPAIDSNAFPDTPFADEYYDSFLSSTPFVGLVRTDWYVSFANGISARENEVTSGFRVRCVQ